jgi:hypothetical protein
MSKIRVRKALVATALTAAVVAVGTVVTASPAMAYSADCNPIGGWWCQTANVSASNSHKIHMEAYWRHTMCRLYDRDNGIQVASLYVPQGSIWRERDVTGLYNVYFMVCGSDIGQADGYIHNNL